jgi:hypothetical protein
VLIISHLNLNQQKETCESNDSHSMLFRNSIKNHQIEQISTTRIMPRKDLVRSMNPGVDNSRFRGDQIHLSLAHFLRRDLTAPTLISNHLNLPAHRQSHSMHLLPGTDQGCTRLFVSTHSLMRWADSNHMPEEHPTNHPRVMSLQLRLVRPPTMVSVRLSPFKLPDLAGMPRAHHS